MEQCFIQRWILAGLHFRPECLHFNNIGLICSILSLFGPIQHLVKDLSKASQIFNCEFIRFGNLLNLSSFKLWD